MKTSWKKPLSFHLLTVLFSTPIVSQRLILTKIVHVCENSTSWGKGPFWWSGEETVSHSQVAFIQSHIFGSLYTVL
jgi:hypothetical protein